MHEMFDDRIGQNRRMNRDRKDKKIRKVQICFMVLVVVSALTVIIHAYTHNGF